MKELILSSYLKEAEGARGGGNVSETMKEVYIFFSAFPEKTALPHVPVTSPLLGGTCQHARPRPTKAHADCAPREVTVS